VLRWADRSPLVFATLGSLLFFPFEMCPSRARVMIDQDPGHGISFYQPFSYVAWLANSGLVILSSNFSHAALQRMASYFFIVKPA
jgi:hypothetical protein